MATTSIPNSSKAIRLKLLVDKNSNKVLFAEAGKEFVDFLFGLIHIPIGSIMGLLRTHGIAGPGALSGVYESIQSLDPSCLHQSKDSFLMPQPAFPSDTHPPPLLKNFLPPKQDTSRSVEMTQPASSSETSQGCRIIRTEDGRLMFSRISPIPNKSVVEQKKETGYVRGVVTFMVMDDLTVKPMSTISSITLLNTFNVKDVSSLQEKTVNVDIKKGLELVKASFGSTTVLTDVFVGNKTHRLHPPPPLNASATATPTHHGHERPPTHDAASLPHSHSLSLHTFELRPPLPLNTLATTTVTVMATAAMPTLHSNECHFPPSSLELLKVQIHGIYNLPSSILRTRPRSSWRRLMLRSPLFDFCASF